MPALTPTDRLAVLDRAASAGGAVTAAEGILHTITGDYLAQPPAAILARVSALQAFADNVQGEYLLEPADTARLWKVAAVAAGIRGWLENNAGNTAAARVSLREAHRFGDLIDDGRLIAWTRYMQATIEDYAGDPDAAEHYARDGLRHTTKRSPQRALLLGGVIARARATRGDLDGVDKAVGEAEIVIAQLSPEQHGPSTRRIIIDSMVSCRPTECAIGAGPAYAILGRLDRFDDVTAEGRQAAELHGTTDRVVLRMDEGLSVLRTADPDPERAAVLARSALALASPFQTAHAATRLDKILAAARPYEKHPAIRDLIEFSAAWRAERRVQPVTEA